MENTKIKFPLPSYFSCFEKIDRKKIREKITEKIVAHLQATEDRGNTNWFEVCMLLIDQTWLIWSTSRKGELKFDPKTVLAANEYWERTLSKRRKFSISSRVSKEEWGQVAKVAKLISTDKIPGLTFKEFNDILHIEFILAEYRLMPFPDEKPVIGPGFLYGGEPIPFLESFAPKDWNGRRK